MGDERVNIFALTEEQRQTMRDEAIALGRKIVDLADKGELKLKQSSIKDGALFLSMGEGRGYFALTADKFGLTPDLSLDNIGPVPVATILGAIEQMKKWVSRAERNS